MACVKKGDVTGQSSELCRRVGTCGQCGQSLSVMVNFMSQLDWKRDAQRDG